MTDQTQHYPSDKDFAQTLNQQWKTSPNDGVAYINHQTRIRLSIEHNIDDISVLLSYAETDQDKSDAEFVKDFIAPIEGELSAHRLSLLTLAFGRRLIEWARVVDTDDSMGLAFDTAEKLQEEAVLPRPAKEKNS